MDQAEKTVEPDVKAAERASAAPSPLADRGSRAPSQPATIRRLQSGLGNAAFARLMTSRRRPALQAHSPSVTSNSASQTLFREASEEPDSPAPLAPMLIQRDDSAGGVPPSPPQAPSGPSSSDSSGGPPASPPSSSGETGIELIRKINNYAWVGPLDEIALETEWNKLGPEGARQYPQEFKVSIDRGAEPKGRDEVINQFKTAVIWLRDQYLDGNIKDVDKEKKRLGIDEEKPSDEQKAHLNELVELAQKAQTLDAILKSYGQIQVGYGEEQEHDPTDPDSPRATVLVEKPAHFIPGEPPKKPLRGGEQGARSFDEVSGQYASTMGALMAIANKHPSIYLALKNNQIDSLAGKEEQEPTDPLAASKTMLADAEKAIQKTRDNRLDWEELKPIHTQLLSGEKAGGGINFGDVWNREIIKDEIGFKDDVKTAVDVGIGMAAACAFIFSEIATAGWATVFWAGVGLSIGGGNAARKWGSYTELKAAAGAGTSQATELVEKGQVNSALLDAVIESAFFFIDAVGIGIKGVKAAQALGIKRAGVVAAEKAADLAALKTLRASAADKTTAAAIKKSMDVVGIKRTAEAAGMSVDELMAKAAGDEVVQAEIKGFLEASAKGLKSGELPAALRAVLKGEPIAGEAVARSAEDVFRQAVDELGVPGVLQEVAKDGKGWKDVASLLGPKSEAGKRMKAWRDVVKDDLAKYIESLRVPTDPPEKLFQETGTLTDVTNDLDMSMLGPRSAELKDKAALFLAGRTGFSADAKILDKMVYIGLFTDPRRMHLFDTVEGVAKKGLEGLQESLVTKTMKFEEQLIWNDEYYKYLLKAGEDAESKRMAEQIAKEMETLGIAKMPEYKPLSDKAISLLSKEQDDLHKAIAAAAEKVPPDRASIEKNIERLSNVQAQINVKEGGGYFSSGGVRKFVTDKEKFPGARVAASATHDVGAATDQIAKLRTAIIDFEHAVPSGDPATISKYIKTLSKYGDRYAESAKVLGASAPKGFEDMAERFSKLIEEARSGAIKDNLAAGTASAEKVIADVRAATSAFDEQNIAIIQALRARAGIVGSGVDVATDITKMTAQRAQFLEAQRTLLNNMTSAIRAAGIPLNLVDQRSDDSKGSSPSGSDDEPKGDFNTPPSNNSGAG